MKTINFTYGEYQKARTFFITIVSAWFVVLLVLLDSMRRQGTNLLIPTLVMIVILLVALAVMVPRYCKKQVYKGKAEFDEDMVTIHKGKAMKHIVYEEVMGMDLQPIYRTMKREVVGYRIILVVGMKNYLLETRCDRKYTRFEDSDLYPVYQAITARVKKKNSPKATEQAEE